MTWDKESRMLTNSLANASYVYNGFDARVSKTVSSNTTTFKRAGADPVSPVLSDVAGSTTTNYLPGISSRVGSTSTFSHSGIKNGILQTNSSQSNTATKRYDAFGNELSTSGTWQTRFDYGGGFGYQRDDESGYKLLGHRYYDPEIGRFLTRDPIKDGRNWYAYCENDPIAFRDPKGNLPILGILAVGAVVYGGIKLYDHLNQAEILSNAETNVKKVRRKWENGWLEFDRYGLERVEYGLPSERMDEFERRWKETSLEVQAGAAVVLAGWEVNETIGGGLGDDLPKLGGVKSSIGETLPSRVRPPWEEPFENGRLPTSGIPVNPRDVGRTWR